MCFPCSMTPVHPHACGENDILQEIIDAWDGTPPRLWGKHLRGRVNAVGGNGTPPRLWGKHNVRIASRRRANTVHPHACGENILLGTTPPRVGKMIWIYGTPPRLWGKRCRTITGITARDDKPASPVHPHACGENCVILTITDCISVNGTPPRLWGKREDRVVFKLSLRYTPTPVGKTCFRFLFNC